MDLDEQGLELADPEDPVVQAMVRVRRARLMAMARSRPRRIEEAAAQKRFLNDPKYLLDQELAAEAGRRFADPLPEGTETESKAQRVPRRSAVAAGRRRHTAKSEREWS